MATDITVLTAAEAKNASLALPAGGRCKVVWRITDDTVIHTWAGTVMEKLANWVVVVYSEGPTDPTIRYDLPYQSGGVQYIAIGPENDPRSAGNMLTAIRARPNLFSITEWRPQTWGHLLHPTSNDRVTSRAQLIGELRTFFSLKVRHELSVNSDGLETELATAYDLVFAWISFAQTVTEWKTPPILGLIEPLIIRLCALRRASPYKDEKRRSDAMLAVYRAVNQSSATKDKLSELMLEPLARQ